MSEMSVADALLLDRRHDGDDYGFGGNSWMWIILLFAIFGWGGNGFGNNGYGNAGFLADQTIATKAAVSDGFDFNQLDNGIRAVQNGICDSTYALRAAIGDTKYDLQTAIKDCCCNTQRNIDSVRYDMSRGFCDVINAGNMNTRDILEANNAGVQKILDYMCANEKAALRDRIQTLETSGIVQAQTQNLVAQLQPVPRPSYLVSSPFAAYNPPYANNVYGNGCGCGCGVFNGYGV